MKPRTDLAGFENGHDLLPLWGDIPDRFKSYNDTYVKLVRKWFFDGLRGATFTTREGIDQSDAIRHIKVALMSWDTSHEHKMAGCAYLASLWFSRVEVPHTDIGKGQPTNPGAAAKRAKKHRRSV